VIHRVEIGKREAKQLRAVPGHIGDKLAIWLMAVELEGLEQVRKVRGCRTRFSVRSYSMTSCWLRLTHPAMASSKSWAKA